MRYSLAVLLLGVLFRIAAAAPVEQASPPLLNAGFESAKMHAGWTLHVYGAQPALASDPAIRHEGRQSLRIRAAEPSDTALGQELDLKPGQLYRLRGWIRTENLDPGDAPVCGTLQVQHPGGRGIIATGQNHRGASDWTQEMIYFLAPDGGRTRIAIFFVGFGKGTGTAWFDDLTLEECPDQDATIVISSERLSSGSISPFQNGQFIEYLCALTLSMFAEQIHDGSFEGVPAYAFEFRRQTDRLEQPWYPDGAVHRGEFTLDRDNPFNGRLSQRIRQKDGAPSTLSISQPGKSVRQGQPLRCSVYLRADGVAGPVQVGLWGEASTYATAEFNPAKQWQRLEAKLIPSKTDAQATFTLSFRGPGTLWIDQVSLMPEDSVFGWRRDVAEALKALQPGIVRFGGSTIEGFDWKATIGDPDRRVPFTTCWGGLEPGNAGLEEFVKLCRWANAEPLICIRFTGRKPSDAAEQVQYFNGPATSPMGRLRAANGHPEPYGVKYWQIGNELGDETYQKGVAEFCRAMKDADPGIKLLAAFPSPGLLRNAGGFIDYICPHHYGCDNLAAMEADIARCRRMIAENAPGRPIRLAITEWNTTAGDWGLARGMLWTLDNALKCARYQNLMHRHCDIVEIANRSNLADSFCSGIIQTNNHALYFTPTYYAQKLYAHKAGDHPLKLTTTLGPADPALDVSATLSADGRRVSIFIVNDTSRSQSRTLDLSAFGRFADEVALSTLADTAAVPERDAANSWREPDRIRTVESSARLVDGKLKHAFPPLSLTVLELRRP